MALDEARAQSSNGKGHIRRTVQHCQEARAWPAAYSSDKESSMLVKEAMSRDIKIVAPDQSIQEAAKIMLEIDAGALPVGENDKLVGMITDRDIAVRAVCAGKPPTTRVRDVMTKEVKYCYEDEDTAHVGRNMGEQQVRRLPVVNRDKRLVGMVALADLATSARTGHATAALSGISRPGGAHTQTRPG